MRIQFVRVPSEGSFGATDKVLMCVSEVENKPALGEFFDGIRKQLGLSAALVTNEVVRFEPAQPEPDMDCDTQPEPPVAAELWDAAVSPHGPCQHIACSLDHCKCEHKVVLDEPAYPLDVHWAPLCSTCLARPGKRWVKSKDCTHA